MQRAFSAKMAALGTECREKLGADPICNRSAVNTDTLTAVQLLPSLVELAPYVILTVGIVFALFPPVARAQVERRWRPKPLSGDYPSAAVADIRTQMSRYPSVVLQDCLARQDLTAFVYPLDYRRIGLVLGGNLMRIWRKAHDVAMAILVHELSHWRQGEGMLLHAGSPLLMSLRFAPWVFLAVGLGPTLVIQGVLAWEHFSSVPMIGSVPLYGPWTIVAHELWMLLRTTIPHLTITILTGACVFLIPFIPLIAAIWSAELCADRVAARLSPVGYPEFLRELRLSGGFWRRARDLLTHPPRSLRLWFAARAQSNAVLVLALLVFPASFFILKLPEFFESALERYAGSIINPLPHPPPPSFGAWSAAMWSGGLRAKWLILLLCAGYVAVWPIVSRVLMRLRGQGDERPVPYGVYAITAGLLVLGSWACYSIPIIPFE
jgi:Zn-dependent protease with chaperone function